MNFRNQFVVAVIVLSFLTGCRSLPNQLDLPWFRHLHSGEIPSPPAHISVTVTGSTRPLIGDEALLVANIRHSFEFLITRRGFVLDRDNPDFVAQIEYRTERYDRLNYSSVTQAVHSSAAVSGVGINTRASQALGVSLAMSITALSASGSTTAIQTTQQYTSYTHSISIQLRNRAGRLIWKGESTWDSPSLDLGSRIVFPLQLILSDLPSDGSVIPKVNRVKDSHALNYYRVECDPPNWFTCPSLPYRIFFDSRERPSPLLNAVPKQIKDTKALAAYVDLLQTAEYALPGGDSTDWGDPLKPTLWNSVTLGGKYYLGDDNQPTNILIELTSKPDGYYITRGAIVSDDEFQKFSERFDRWKHALNEYYDFFDE